MAISSIIDELASSGMKSTDEFLHTGTMSSDEFVHPSAVADDGTITGTKVASDDGKAVFGVKKTSSRRLSAKTGTLGSVLGSLSLPSLAPTQLLFLVLVAASLTTWGTAIYRGDIGPGFD